MENKKLYIGLGIAAVAGFAYYMWSKKEKAEGASETKSGADGRKSFKKGERVCRDGKVFIYTGENCGVGGASKNINTDANGNCPKGYDKMDNSPLGYICSSNKVAQNTTFA